MVAHATAESTKAGYLMSWRACVVILGASLCLAGCVDERAAQIADFVPRRFLDQQNSPLRHAVGVGEVSGGGIMLGNNITDRTFANAMTATLQRNALLAERGGERWRLDCTLDFDQTGSSLSSHTVTARIRYVLRETAGNAVAFDKTIETSQGRQGTGTAFTFTLADARFRGTEDSTVRENLDIFLTELKAWDAAR
jgi:hypothetical protein